MVVVVALGRCALRRGRDSTNLKTFSDPSPLTTRWSTTLSSKDDLPHTIHSRDLGGGDLVTHPPEFWGIETSELHCVASTMMLRWEIRAGPLSSDLNHNQASQGQILAWTFRLNDFSSYTGILGDICLWVGVP